MSNETPGVVDAPAASVLLDEEGNPVSAIVELPQNDGDGETELEAVETVADTAVAIATIEADRDVTIAAIHADTEAARIAADAERDLELTAAKERITWLETEMTNTLERNRELESQLTSLPSPEELEEATEELVEAVEALDPSTIDTSETGKETSSSIETEAPAKSEDASPAVAEGMEAVQAAKRRLLKFL